MAAWLLLRYQFSEVLPETVSLVSVQYCILTTMNFIWRRGCTTTRMSDIFKPYQSRRLELIVEDAYYGVLM